MATVRFGTKTAEKDAKEMAKDFAPSVGMILPAQQAVKTALSAIRKVESFGASLGKRAQVIRKRKTATNMTKLFQKRKASEVARDKTFHVLTPSRLQPKKPLP